MFVLRRLSCFDSPFCLPSLWHSFSLQFAPTRFWCASLQASYTFFLSLRSLSSLLCRNTLAPALDARQTGEAVFALVPSSFQLHHCTDSTTLRGLSTVLSFAARSTHRRCLFHSFTHVGHCVFCVLVKLAVELIVTVINPLYCHSRNNRACGRHVKYCQAVIPAS